MTLQIRHVSTRLLLILALAAALLAGLVAVGWAMGQQHLLQSIVTSSQPQYMVPVGDGFGGGSHRTGPVGGDLGGGH
jgi:hypothetical protein